MKLTYAGIAVDVCKYVVNSTADSASCTLIVGIIDTLLFVNV